MLNFDRRVTVCRQQAISHVEHAQEDVRHVDDDKVNNVRFDAQEFDWSTVAFLDFADDDALEANDRVMFIPTIHGGASYDYTAWALAVSGVTRAWVYPAELGLGTVTVRFVRDLDATPIPDAGEVAAVQAYIDARRPVTAQVTVVAPTAVPINFQIQGLTPSNATVQAAVQAELQDLLLRESVPGGTILLSHIRAAISAAAGETDYVLVSPAANVTNTTGNMSTIGTITWL